MAFVDEALRLSDDRCAFDSRDKTKPHLRFARADIACEVGNVDSKIGCLSKVKNHKSSQRH
jgi:hypothetical protein